MRFLSRGLRSRPAGASPHRCARGHRFFGSAGSLPPIYWTYFPDPVPYSVGLALQEALVRLCIDAKNAAEFTRQAPVPTTQQPQLQPPPPPSPPDVLLLLQHRPVYTAGRRERGAEALEAERDRLRRVAPGADHAVTKRGGQTTFHGPGQLVGYPILDLSLNNLSTRCYVDRLLSFLSSVLVHPSLPAPLPTLPASTPGLPVGTFLTPTTKLGSVGVQVRRRVASHGFSLNVERSVEPWFAKIVACGLDGVEMTSVQSALLRRGQGRGAAAGWDRVDVLSILQPAVETFGKVMGREMEPLERLAGRREGEKVIQLIEAAKAGVEVQVGGPDAE